MRSCLYYEFYYSNYIFIFIKNDKNSLLYDFINKVFLNYKLDFVAKTFIFNLMKQTVFAVLTSICLTLGAFFTVGSNLNPSLEEQFNSWKKEFNIGQNFNPAENLYRMKIF